jgi:hypothetical protein
VTTIEGTRLLSPNSAAGLLVALATSALLLSGCHVTVGNPVTPSSTPASGAVPKNALEQITAQQVRDKIGGGNIVITCPHDLAIKLGASEDCTMAQDSKQFPLKITITKVKSADDAVWDWELGKQLTPS